MKSKVTLFTAFLIALGTSTQVMANTLPVPDGGASAALLALSIAGLSVARKLVRR